MNISSSTSLIKDSTGQNEFAFIPIQTSNHKCLLLLLRTSPHSSFPYPLFPIVYQFEFSIFEFKKIVKQELQGYFHKTLNTFHPHSLIKDRKGGTNSSQRLHNEIPRTRVTREGGGRGIGGFVVSPACPPENRSSNDNEASQASCHEISALILEAWGGESGGGCRDRGVPLPCVCREKRLSSTPSAKKLNFHRYVARGVATRGWMMVAVRRLRRFSPSFFVDNVWIKYRALFIQVISSCIHSLPPFQIFSIVIFRCCLYIVSYNERSVCTAKMVYIMEVYPF